MRLQVKNIRVGYENQTIVQDLSMDIPDGKITTIIGSNGCGKSTLLKAMTRIIGHQDGHIVLDGKNIHSMNTKELAKQLAILTQNPESANGLLVEELVSYGRFPYQKGFGNLSKKDKEIIDWALQVTRTNEFRYKTVDALSGGQRQRVWIAMALAQDTDIIFLDEPTTYLDMAHQLEVLELLQMLNKEEGKTIIMVLHDLNQAARFSDFLLAMSKGKLIKAGSADEVITPPILREVFQIDALIDHDPRTNKPMCITYNLLKGEKKHEKNITIDTIMPVTVGSSL
ncbi:ABC transporter ATP-binding protein [Ornithinibacillus xuwenensis]|uniref:ABC transporter ATP-binding protein n=1 Tax=Ornithinibacillus xuwenensis TaxID=3144668 RepID=A0ABU9XGN8_9BACI